MNSANWLDDWELLKQVVYFEDGSLRDIRMGPFSAAEWKQWAIFVNRTYPRRFDYGDGRGADPGTTSDQIDMARVQDYWNKPESGCPSVSIRLGELLVNAYFPDATEFENDITPREIRTFDAHTQLMDYLRNISLLLQRPVELTLQNPTDARETLLIIDRGIVQAGPAASSNRRVS